MTPIMCNINIPQTTINKRIHIVSDVVSRCLPSISNIDESITTLSFTEECIELLQNNDNRKHNVLNTSDKYWGHEEFRKLGCAISKLPSLYHLIIDMSHVLNNNFNVSCTEISNSLTIKKITFVNVSFYHGFESHLFNLPNLSNIMFSNCEIDPIKLCKVSFQKCLNLISELRFFGCKVNFISKRDLEQFVTHMKHDSSLTYLEFMCCDLPHDTMTMISQITTTRTECIVKIKN